VTKEREGSSGGQRRPATTALLPLCHDLMRREQGVGGGR
jgi:hypothetical protein